jgi:predicted secreted protein
VPEVAMSSTGVAVTSTVAVVLAVVAASALSASAAVVCNDPEAEEEMSTVAVTVASTVPAGIRAAVELQVSTVPPPLSAQLHPETDGAAANVSPVGRVA